MKRFINLFAILSVISYGCGGSSPSAPTVNSTPAPPAAAVNHAPQITGMNFGPTFGIAQLTTFTFSASATDPDGDALTYTWSVGGNPYSGANGGQIVFAGPGDGSAQLTVTDSKGMSATDSRAFTVGGMTGTWKGTWSAFVFTAVLTQNGTKVTGDYSDQVGACKVDPAAPNTIDANGNIVLRWKGGPYSDFTFTGRMESTGRRITGSVNGSGANNTPFTMNRQ